MRRDSIAVDNAPEALPVDSSTEARETDGGARIGALRLAWYNVFEFSKAHLRRIAKRREVSVVRLAPGFRKARHVLITTVHNEAHRIAYFLRYYRELGIEHFIIIDNRSTDGLRVMLEQEPDVSIFFARGVYRNARFGMDWVNGLLSKYCVDKWVVCADADEFLAYPYCDTRSIAGLTDHLARHGQRSLGGLMVDMYSDRQPSENVCQSGGDPVAVCPLYDRSGYQSRFDPLSRTTWIKGGVRGRLFFPDVWSGPALNKTPLVHWKAHFAYIKSSHELWPPRLNQPTRLGEPRMTGALLHFKFLADFEGKLETETARQQHTVEYAAYTGLLDRGGEVRVDFVGGSTTRYEGWRSLLRDGLISTDGVFTG